MPTDYSRGKIYCIRSPNTDKVYVGSTCEPYLSRRLVKHNKKKKGWDNGTSKSYYSSFVILECGDAYIELLETYPCNSIDELRAKEGEYIRKMNCVNIQIAGRTKSDWYQDNKERVIKRVREWEMENKERVIERKRKWYKLNKEREKLKRNEKFECECGGRYTQRNKSSHIKTKKHKAFLEK